MMKPEHDRRKAIHQQDVNLPACEVCKKEVGRDDAVTEEAEEYVLWFCGQDCFAKWKRDQSR